MLAELPDEFSGQLFAAKEQGSVFFVKVLQALEGWFAGSGGFVFGSRCYGRCSNNDRCSGFGLDNMAASGCCGCNNLVAPDDIVADGHIAGDVRVDASALAGVLWLSVVRFRHGVR